MVISGAHNVVNISYDDGDVTITGGYGMHLSILGTPLPLGYGALMDCTFNESMMWKDL